MSLKINNVTKRFGEKVILDNFSYSFTETGLYIVTGESGIGKTTLIRMIAGLDKDFFGEISNGGIDNTSFMFQEYRLFPTLTALKNAAIPLKSEDIEKAAKLLHRLGFSEDDVKKKPVHLSGGMKQRVAFARAVLMSSPILILDEPTKELDAESVKSMLEIIEESAEKRLVIAVTHDDMLLKLKTSAIIKF